MKMAVQWPDDTMFRHFDVFEETFKIVETHDIKAVILIPKSAKPGLHPVLINIHGGFLVYGHALFAPFFAPWILKLGLESSAIVISADHRLLPSANGAADVVADLEDFWHWTRNTLPGVLANRSPGHLLDFSHLLVTGASAGGFCAMHLAMSHPDEISAVAMSYPFVDPKDDVIVSGPKPEDPSILRFNVEELPAKETVLDWIEQTRKTVQSRAGWERTKFAVAATQYGLFYSKIFDSNGTDSADLIPIERLRSGARLPKKIWILQGEDDSVVYVPVTRRFVDLMRQKLPNTTVRLDIALGEDHAFDLTKTSWELHAIGAMDFVKESWLGDDSSVPTL